MSQGQGGGRPLKFNDPDALQIKIDEYFNTTTDNPPTLEGLAVYLGCGTSTLRDYQAEHDINIDRDIQTKLSATIKTAKERCGQSLVASGLGARNPAMHIFLLKNNYNYRDKTEQEITVVGLGDALKDLDKE